MSDETSMLAANLLEAFKQLNQFVTLALVTSMSALVLEYHLKQVGGQHEATSIPDEKVSVIGGFVPMSREAAQLLFLGVCYVAALLGSFTLQSVFYIVGRLGASTPLVEAVCTYSSVATGPIGIRVAGVALPALFGAVVIGRKWWSLREPVLFWMLVVFVATFAILGLGMIRIPCSPR